MKKSDFKKGQDVVLLRMGSLRNHNTVDERIVRAKVISVGRKYITVSTSERFRVRSVQFEIEDDFREVTDYSPNYRLFLTEEALRKHCERKSIERQVDTAFRRTHRLVQEMSLDDLKVVCEIISKYREDS